MSVGSDREPIAQLSETFGNYKAEYLRERIFDLFTKPSYFPELETGRPCALIGGRGTGKTTVLRSLSYEGRFRINHEDATSIPHWRYFGFYLRVDTNRVRAFQGPDLRPATWTKLFAHYFNLLLCGQVLKFVDWYANKTQACSPDTGRILPPAACRLTAISLGLQPSDTALELRGALNVARVSFEAFLNNVRQDDLPQLSLQGAPVDELMAALSRAPGLINRHFFFLIDEFENFLDDQQVVLNTLIKHSGGHHTFKVGARELGWRVRHTLNPEERLSSPADYALIEIGKKLNGDRFERFAADIMNRRIAEVDLAGQGLKPDIQTLFPSLSTEEEAAALGVSEALNDRIKSSGWPQEIVDTLLALPPLEALFAASFGTGKRTIRALLEERERRPEKWRTRFDNYRHSLLFGIKRGKTGIRKAYAGWNTFVLLSGGNIRYLIELVDQTLLAHAHAGGSLQKPVDWQIQTRAATDVGRKNVSELEGLSVQGANLTKLVLALGRVFQVLAMDQDGHAPEINQFHLPDEGAPPGDVAAILEAGVMHLALVRSSGSKLSRSEPADYDYSLHPIFAAFFVFSHRRKRKMKLSYEQIIGLVKSPATTIEQVLRGNNRDPGRVAVEQLALFQAGHAPRDP